jgi:hypothetical protein
MDVTVFSSGWFLPEMGPKPLLVLGSTLPKAKVVGSPAAIGDRESREADPKSAFEVA